MNNYYDDLKGKTALITGASQGIGYSIADKYCQSEAKVALIDISETALENAKQKLTEKYPAARIEPYICDISNAYMVFDIFRKIEEDFRSIDILVNNAGILRRSFIESMELGDWDIVLKVNLTGVFNCCRAALPAMKKAGAGAIVNVSSNVAAVPSVEMGAYCVSKTGVETLTRVMAAEFAPYNIRVNAYAPGVVETEMTSDILKKRADEKLKTIPMGRFIQPCEVADLVMFLTSDASKSIDGTVVAIDGGMLATQNPWKAKK